MRLIYILSSLLIFSSISLAQVNVSGPISVNTTWSKANSPYIVTGNVTVNTGYILTIETGTLVQFNAGTNLYINGALNANGTTVDTIVFTANSLTPTVGYWGGIVLNNSTIGSQTIMNYCVIKYAGTGGCCSARSPIVLDGRINPRLSNLTLYNDVHNAIELMSNTYNQNITLDVTDKPYFVIGGLSIATGYTMTMKPGVIIKMDIGYNDIGISGALNAIGKPDSLITFTSIKDDSSGNNDSNGDG
ncbi:MAG: hypothetical protein ACHQQQ_13250, partial [Bacteroidota bacterium]